MCKKIVVYLFLLLILLYLFFLYDEPIPAGLLVFGLIYAAAAYIEVWCAVRQIQVKFGHVLPITDKKKNVTVSIKILNRTWLPGLPVCIDMTLGNQMAKQTIHRKLRGYCKARGETNLTYDVSSDYCGSIVLAVTHVAVYDYFGIFSSKRKVREEAHIGILPELNLIPMEVTRKTREFIADAEEYSTERSGDDPSEVYQVREYQERDSLHDVHWKLTAKTGCLMVKEHGMPLGSSVLIWLDLKKQKASGLSDLNRLLELTASISMTLSEEKIIHLVSWYETKNKRMIKRKITKLSQVYELAHRLLLLELYDDRKTADQCYEDTYQNIVFSCVIIIGLDGTILVNGEQQANHLGDIFLTV